MKKEEIFKKLLQTVGVTAEEANKLITSDEEVEFTLPEGTFFNNDDLNLRDKAKYEEGKTAGRETFIKEVRDDFGVSFEGKTKENLVAAIRQKVESDAKIEPDKKVSELQKDNDALRNTITELESTSNEIKSTYEKKTLNYEFTNKMNATVNPEKLKDGWNQSFVESVFLSKYKPQRDENGNMVLVDVSTNEVVKNDKTRAPEAPENVISSFITEQGMINTDRSGRGTDGGIVGGGKVSKYSHIKTKADFFKHCESEGINPNGEQAVALAAQLAKDNNDFGKE